MNHSTALASAWNTITIRENTNMGSIIAYALVFAVIFYIEYTGG